MNNPMTCATVYLSRRNLESLLAKLERPESQKTIVKTDTVHPTHPCSHIVRVIAVENEDYYTDRDPGPIHPSDAAQSEQDCA